MAPWGVTRKFAVAGLAAALVLPALQAQGQKGGAPTGIPTGSGTAGVGTTPTTGAPNTGNTTVPGANTGVSGTNPQPTMSSMPVYLIGKVALEDGSPPPDLVTIERVCNGVVHNAGYTDTHGAFAIELGNEQGVFQDATDGAGLGGRGMSSSSMTGQVSPRAQERMLQNCELRGKLPGYRSQSIMLAGRRPMDDPNIGTILIHKEGASEGTMVSATSLAAPKNAQKLYDKGLDLAKKGRLGDAIDNFQKALEIYPNYAAAWTELGKAQAAAGRKEEARFALESAVKLDAKYVEPYLELSILAYQGKQWPELRSLTARAIKLDSFTYPQLFMFNSLAHYSLHETEEAEQSVKEAERLDTQHRFPEILHLHGLIYAQRHEYAMACDQLRTYLKLVPGADDIETVRGQLAQFEKATAETAAKEPKN